VTRQNQRLICFLQITNHGSRITLLACLFLIACAPATPPQHLEFLAMGTIVSIDVVGVDAQKAFVAMTAARGDIEYLGREWYPWANSGELVRLNAALAKGETVSVSPAMVKLIKQSQEAFRQSDGLFDPAVAPMVERWGFQHGERDASQTIPSEAQLKTWEANHPTFADVVIKDNQIGGRRNDLMLDFGAIGKGYAVDLAIERLQRLGVDNALVNAGGNLRAIGHTMTDSQIRAWHVAIRNPRADEPLAWLELRGGEGVSTSGDYERFAIIDGQRFHHILDPHTGRPAMHTAAVTVVARDATTADAASTAIFVAGPARWREIAQALGVSEVLRVDANGSIEVSRALMAKLRMPGSEPRQIPWTQVDL
jgi:FAD:protein FMN transferase